MKLSILIPTVEERKEQFEKLLDKITGEINNKFRPGIIEIIKNDAPRHDLPNGISVGEKRNRLLLRAKGEYIWYIDDDDDYTPGIIADILQYINYYPEVICAKTRAFINGKPYIINTSIHHENEQLHDNGEIKRFPSVMNVYRRDVALRGRFPDLNNGEDFVWSQSLNITNEVKLDSIWHIYNFDSEKTIASK